MRKRLGSSRSPGGEPAVFLPKGQGAGPIPDEVSLPVALKVAPVLLTGRNLHQRLAFKHDSVANTAGAGKTSPIAAVHQFGDRDRDQDIVTDSHWRLEVQGLRNTDAARPRQMHAENG